MAVERAVDLSSFSHSECRFIDCCEESGIPMEATRIDHRRKNCMLGIPPARLGCFCEEGEHVLGSVLPKVNVNVGQTLKYFGTQGMGGGGLLC